MSIIFKKSLHILKHSTAAVILICISLFSSAQQKNPAKAGKPVFQKLKDGVYLSFEDVKKNQPNLVREDLFKSYYDSSFTLLQWANSPNLYYVDKTGNRKSLNRDSIWGYCENSIPYICLNQRFHKVSTVGAVLVFTEYYPVIRDPLSLVVTDIRGTSVSRILDFENGGIVNYDLDSFNSILIRDENLFNEFNAFKKLRAKKKKMYLYIEKYNERHPMFETSANTN